MSTMISGHRVLLVDDEPALLGMLRRIVEHVEPSAVIVYASDWSTAEWQLQSTTLRLVITDLRLHSDDRAGFRIVDAAEKAGVPVAVFTGADGAEIEELEGRGITVVRKARMTSGALAEIVARAFAT